ncbi:HelD family protein [Kitasatospora aureofaciens]|uniref:AAA family ATPase n=1 Tax=Kitasatospora aureofaciens TaxID=1894 RepID=A0A1E7N6F5_KITAU|nr:ATPase AAA [Kitasatospora aureofaciens]OEV36272.1 AAA family ATPase [Kitasatospora aureofaciens]GGU56598.1 DNA helicase [Kitasatospora aureofaciens]
MTSKAMGLDGELARERSYVESCRAASARQVADADHQVVAGEDVSGDGASAEALGRYLRTRAKRMKELPESPVFFGRLDFGDAPEAGDHRGQRYYVGRRRISEDPTVPPLVVDWRAPVSRAFYRASAHDPLGLAGRRRFGWAPSSPGLPEDLTGLEDELLGDADGRGPSRPGGILTAEIERPRTGPMRDIVATIQPEQDELVRGELSESVCVQGAPGSGKTAVGLHRAAYLLYSFPQRIRRGGLLVIGPNRTFLRYIAEVLPALGELDVSQCTVEDLVASRPVTAVDGERAAAVKQDARMAEVLRRALYGRIRAAGSEPLVVPEGSYRWRVPGERLDRLVAEVREQAAPYAIGRENVRARVVALIQHQAERRTDVKNATWQQKIGRCRPVAAFLETAWPALRPETVVAALLGDPAVLAGAAHGVLDTEEQAALRWPRPPRSERSAKWSEHDLLLLDEVAGLIERPASFGHVVVDEAQDLSPMQCRAIARRSAFGSLTVLGDLAQATAPWSARSWAEQLAHLGKPQAALVPLTTGYRVPAAVMALANRLLGALDVDVPPALSLRPDGEVTVRPVPDLDGAVVAAVRAALQREGSIAVIAADDTLTRAAAALRAAGIPTAPAEDAGTTARVTALPAALAKGLEYDHVIVLEPAAIAEAEPRGLHRLYVVLTRAVSRLDLLHTRPLPAPLTTP